MKTTNPQPESTNGSTSKARKTTSQRSKSKGTKMTTTYNPTPEDEEALSLMEAGYIGYDKVIVDRKFEDNGEIPMVIALMQDGDNWAGDPEQADLTKED